MGGDGEVFRFLIQRRQLARRFLEVELGVALLGGTSAAVLFLSFAFLEWFRPVLFGMVFLIGTLVGLELPLLMRILEGRLDFKDLVSRVLAFDYIGALLASLMFPIFFVPKLGLVRTSLVFGMLNAAVALWGTWLLRPLMEGSVRGLRARAFLVLGLLGAGFVKADRLTSYAEASRFTNPVVFARSTPYQRIVITSSGPNFQLFLNSNLQFNSVDEYRYHEALVHPAMAVATGAKRALVLGGGDGLAVREILKYPSIESVTLVDLDPGMTGLSRDFPWLRTLNGGALDDPRVRVINDDAFLWLDRPADSKPGFSERSPATAIAHPSRSPASSPSATSTQPLSTASPGDLYDVVFIDFPDPSTFSLGKLYTTRFYRLLRERLAPGAKVALQCTSPLTAPKSYWCVVGTLEAAGFHVRPYHAAVPSFGVWGYALAGLDNFDAPAALPVSVAPSLRYLNDETLRQLFILPSDLRRVPAEINRLDNQSLVRYYEDEWSRWN